MLTKLQESLQRTRERIRNALSKNDAQTALASLEESLLLADCGTEATAKIVQQVTAKLANNFSMAELATAIRAVTNSKLAPLQQPKVAWATKPHVILLVGTNGGGKTTTTAKIAHLATKANRSVILAAADTFRAAATDQLTTLAERLPGSVQVVTAKEPGAVAFNAVAAGVTNQADLVLVDTAGRQPTNRGLMDEASKIARAIGKSMPGAPHETLITLDANTGQNALKQIETFGQAVDLTGMIVTKFDSTARGGVIFAIADKHPLPVHYVGVGEGIDDLVDFNAEDFVAALFAE